MRHNCRQSRSCASCKTIILIHIPTARTARSSGCVQRMVNFFEEKARVTRGNTFTVHGILYSALLHLIGHRLKVRFMTTGSTAI